MTASDIVPYAVCMKQKQLVKSVLFAVVIISIVGLFVYATQMNTEKRSKAAFTQGKACSAQCLQYTGKPLYLPCMKLCARSQPAPGTPTPTPRVFPTVKPTGLCISRCMQYSDLQQKSCLSKCNTMTLPPPID